MLVPYWLNHNVFAVSFEISNYDIDNFISYRDCFVASRMSQQVSICYQVT